MTYVQQHDMTLGTIRAFPRRYGINGRSESARADVSHITKLVGYA